MGEDNLSLQLIHCWVWRETNIYLMVVFSIRIPQKSWTSLGCSNRIGLYILSTGWRWVCLNVTEEPIIYLETIRMIMEDIGQWLTHLCPPPSQHSVELSFSTSMQLWMAIWLSSAQCNVHGNNVYYLEAWLIKIPQDIFQRTMDHNAFRDTCWKWKSYNLQRS